MFRRAGSALGAPTGMVTLGSPCGNSWFGMVRCTEGHSAGACDSLGSPWPCQNLPCLSLQTLITMGFWTGMTWSNW